MKSALVQPRSSALVQAELEAFEEIMKDTPAPPPGDFAAELQWRAWQNHRAELGEELAQARSVEGNQNPLLAGLAQITVKIRHLFGSDPARSVRSEHDTVTAGEEKEQSQNQPFLRK